MFINNMMLSVNPLDEDDDNLLDKVVLNEENVMFLQCVQKAMKKGI